MIDLAEIRSPRVSSRVQTSQDGPLCECSVAALRTDRNADRALDPNFDSGAGLQPLDKMHKPMSQVLPEGTQHVPSSVKTFQPEQNQVTTADGDVIS